MGKAKYWKGLTAAGIVLAVVLVVIVGISVFPEKNIKEYEETEEVFGNPLMGYAPCAWNETVSEDVSLLYMDITWAELEPKEGEYNWESIEKENQLSRWKKEGKHIILRFVCDVPGKEKHMDIPEWLYEKTGHTGTWYDVEFGKGFAPDYNNEQMIYYHAQAVKTLGEHLGGDGLISYIELGSLGHWGEWHVNYSAGIQRLPKEDVREQYVAQWVEAFPDAMIRVKQNPGLKKFKMVEILVRQMKKMLLCQCQISGRQHLSGANLPVHFLWRKCWIRIYHGQWN